MDVDTGEVTLHQQLVELFGTSDRLDKDDDLVKLQVVEQIVELAILLSLVHLDIVLLKAVKRKLGVVIDVDLERVLHELLADGARFLGERGREHHNLLLRGGGAEDLLDIAAHV